MVVAWLLTSFALSLARPDLVPYMAGGFIFGFAVSRWVHRR